MSEIRSVTDVEGRQYNLRRLLGRGGQGEVYAVAGDQLAVKLIHARKSAESYDRLRRQIEFVRRLPLTDIQVARPLAMLAAPDLGYVMELMTDMEPLSRLVRPKSNKDLGQWYIRTGSLQRRLRLLARCAETLSQLHSKGLAYGDLSPNNVFVSSSASEDQAWLIDADNLRYQSSPGAPAPYTRGYGAPEVVCKKSGITSLTDAHSFAVIAFETLSLVHPFKGDFVENGDPEIEDQALEGKVPWIEEPSDDRNRSSRGIPREFVLSVQLSKLFQKAFVDGLHEPSRRPSMARWTERLYVASDHTLICPRCTGTYYYGCTSCPWCDASRPRYLRLTVKLLGGEADTEGQPGPVIAGASVAIPGSLVLTGRLLHGRLGAQAHTPCIELSVAQSGDMHIRSLDGEQYLLAAQDEKRQDIIVKGDRIRFTSNWQLHLGLRNRLHRVIAFKIEGVQR